MVRRELTISTNYVKQWTTWMAIRELIQNMIDGSDGANDYTLLYRKGSNDTYTAYFINEYTSLPQKTLLLGETNKTDDDTKLGQFGEGYKLAFLTLLRSGKKIRLFNGDTDEVWTPLIVKSRVYETDILAVDIEVDPSLTPIYGDDSDLVIEVSGLSADEIEECSDNSLINEVDISVDTLLEEGHRGKIFVGGLFVTKDPDLRFGYSLSADGQIMNRDRDVLIDMDRVAHRIAVTLLQSNLSNDRKFFKCDLSEGDLSGLDLSHMTTAERDVFTPEVKRYLFNKYILNNPTMMPDKRLYIRDYWISNSNVVITEYPEAAPVSFPTWLESIIEGSEEYKEYMVALREDAKQYALTKASGKGIKGLASFRNTLKICNASSTDEAALILAVSRMMGCSYEEIATEEQAEVINRRKQYIEENYLID